MMQPTISRSAICAMILAMYACAAHAQRSAPIRDLAPIIESSVTQQYQPAQEPASQRQAPYTAPRSNQTTQQPANTLQGRQLNACLERKHKIDQQQHKLNTLSADLQRDKQLVAALERRVEQEKPKRSTHSVQAMSNYQALLRQYQQQAESLNNRTHLHNEVAEQNRVQVRQYNSICSGKAYRAANLPAESDYGVQPIQRQSSNTDTLPAHAEPSTSAYPNSVPAANVPGVPSVGGY